MKHTAQLMLVFGPLAFQYRLKITRVKSPFAIGEDSTTVEHFLGQERTLWQRKAYAKSEGAF